MQMKSFKFREEIEGERIYYKNINAYAVIWLLIDKKVTLYLDQEFQNFKEFEMPRIWIALILISFIFQMLCLDKSIQISFILNSLFE